MINLTKTTIETITDKTTNYQKIIKIYIFKIRILKFVDKVIVTEDTTETKIGYKTT